MIALVGHNVAETQTVLWARMLDRLAADQPPAIVCVDPRLTPVAREATVHLAPLPGTNVALMNGLLHEIIAHDWVDHDYIDAHTIGFDELCKRVEDYPPERVAEICRVDADDIRRAARIIGTAQRLLSTVLQGFYQSHQATAASVQVNNIHLIPGHVRQAGLRRAADERPATAENTRECGADGDLPGFRNWANDDHVADLARVWNVEPQQIPHYGPPTHAMQMFRFAEEGTLQMLWVTGTNPAVSLPELARIRDILSQERLFLVVQDIFMTETAELADVVLPAAAWAEKTGTFTKADRTVHLSEKAVDPPGSARSDLEIFLDYARRMDFRDKDGQPLPAWTDPESAFEAWKKCSDARPCDYTGLSYDKLRGGSGIQWPCNAENPDGTERLYTDAKFWAHPDYCETFTRDLVTGAPMEPDEIPGHERLRRGDHQGGPVPAAARGTQFRLPVRSDHRAYPVSLPYPHQNGSGTATSRRRTPGAGSRARPASAASATACCLCRSTTATGTPTASEVITAPATNSRSPTGIRRPSSRYPGHPLDGISGIHEGDDGPTRPMNLTPPPERRLSVAGRWIDPSPWPPS